ncbi:MAG: cupin domain-containing protein [Candidatus Acidiferrum sp.]
MTAIPNGAVLTLLIPCVAVSGSRLVAARVEANAAQKKSEGSRIAFSHDLPPLKGDKLSVTLVEVIYGPGESSTPHSHPCPVIGYVLEGALRTQVQGEPAAIYKAGESFYEAPNGVHLVSANASDKERARLLAYFVCDQHSALSVDVPASEPTKEK